MDYRFFAPWDQVLPREPGHVVAFAGGRAAGPLAAAAAAVYGAEGVPLTRTGPGDVDPGDATVVLAAADAPDAPPAALGPGAAWPGPDVPGGPGPGGGRRGRPRRHLLGNTVPPPGVEPGTVLTWELLDPLVAAAVAAVPADVPVVLALAGLEDQPDSIGLFAFTGRMMEHPRLAVVLFCGAERTGRRCGPAAGPTTSEGRNSRRRRLFALHHHAAPRRLALTLPGTAGIFTRRPSTRGTISLLPRARTPSEVSPVHLTRQKTPFRRALGALAIVVGLLAAGAASAACLPGQMQEADLAYQSASEFLTQQNWDQAIARLKSIVSVCPEHVAANRGIGTAYMGKGDYATAAEWFEKTIVARGDQVEAGDYANLAKAYASEKKYKEARAEYMKAEMLAPDDCGVLFNLAVLHSAAGYHTQAVDVFEHILSLDDCARVHDQALAQIAKAASKAAEQQKKAGNSKQAVYYQDLANQYGGQAGGSTAMDLVRKEMKAGSYDKAVALLQDMLAKNPDQPNATLTLARALDAAGRKSDSVDAFRKYLALKPNDTTEWGTMLQVMVEAGQAEQAQVEAAKAYADHESKGRQALAPILYSWGLALEKAEDYATAKEKFQQCATSGQAKYAGPARTQVQRMSDLMQLQAAQKKKAAQQGG